MPRNANQLADEIEGMWARAEREGRDLTADERQYMKGLGHEAKSQHELEQQIKSIGISFGTFDSPAANGHGAPTGGGPGDVFVASKAYQQVRFDRGQSWATGPVEVSRTPL